MALALGIAACGGEGEGPTFEAEHPRIYIEQNRDRLRAMLEDGRPAAQHFKYLVDLQVDGQDLYDFRAWTVALMGQLTGEPRYCEFAVAQIDAYVDGERALIDDGAAPFVARDSYIEVGIHVGDIALTYDWCADYVGAAQRDRWFAFADQAVWNVWNHEGAQWGGTAMPWSGWSVDNPSNNYYYGFLRATMLLGIAGRGELASADGWLAKFREEKIAGQVVPILGGDAPDGGSLEGTGYGVAMYRLFELYDWWQQSSGEDLARLSGHARASLLLMMHSIVPTLDRIAPIGDHARDASASLFDYHRAYVLILSYLFADEPVAARARYLLARCSVPEMTQHALAFYDFIYDLPALAERPLAPGGDDAGMGLSYVARGTGQIYARSAWDNPDATWLSLIAGRYVESHAHRDQGSLLLFKREWLAYDANIQSSTGLTQEEAAHNLVRLHEGGEDIPQRTETTSVVRAAGRGDGWFFVAVDTTPAYGGRDGVAHVGRSLLFLEPNTLVVFDYVDTSAGISQTWQLNTPVPPAISGDQATITGQATTLVVRRLAPASATATSLTWNGQLDVEGGYRYDATVAGGARRWLHVLSLDGDVTAATASHDGDELGVVLTFADGRAATVRFATDGVGGSLLYEDEGGHTLHEGVLPAEVEALPE